MALTMREICKKMKGTNSDRQVTIIADNMIYVYEDRDKVIWDDTDEVLYILEVNDDKGEPKQSMKIKAMPYEHIQSIELSLNPRAALPILLEFGFPEDIAKKYIEEATTIVL